MSALTRMAEAWWAFLVPASLQVAVVGAVIMIALLLARRAAPLLRLALCAVLLLKLAAPWLPSLELPLLGWREAALPASPGPVELFAARAELPEARNAAAPGAEAGPRAVWTLTSLAFVLYLIVVAAGLTRLAIATGRLRRLRRRGEPYTVAGFPSSVTVRVSEGVDAPCCFGVWTPTILLPRGLNRRVDGPTLRAVLEHERVHLAHRDPALNLIASVLRVLWWFHPAAWWLGPTLRRVQEERCDDAVLRAAGLDAEQYGSALVAVARDLTGGSALPLTSSIFPGEHGQREHALARRLRRIFDPTRTERTSMLHLSAPLFLTVTLVPGVDPTHLAPLQQDAAGEETDPQAETGPAQIDRALLWLAKQQQAAGDFGDGASDGLTVLALLGAGHTESVGPRKDTVAKALGALERRVTSEAVATDRAALLAGCALTEHHLLAGSPAERRPAVEAAVARATAASQVRDLDAELAFWSAMVLVSAKDSSFGDAGAHDAALTRLRDRLPLGATSGAASWSPEATCAASVFLHLATGGDDGHASFQAAQERVLGTLARPVGDDLELVLLGTMAMYQVGGDAWRHWNDGPLKRLGSLQEASGRFVSEGQHDVSATALATLALESRYRYARLMGR